MYNEILLPGHKRSIGWAKGRGLPVILHSCGFVEPLVPGLIEAGIDCLQVIEVKAGMDLLPVSPGCPAGKEGEVPRVDDKDAGRTERGKDTGKEREPEEK